jgi:hypothetical protein
MRAAVEVEEAWVLPGLQRWHAANIQRLSGDGTALQVPAPASDGGGKRKAAAASECTKMEGGNGAANKAGGAGGKLDAIAAAKARFLARKKKK